MKPITTLYIPHVELKYDALYIANVFDKNDIALVSKIAFEPYKNKSISYNKVYIEIEGWHDSEVAFNILTKLRNTNYETKIIHSDDNWWIVEVNKYPHKISNTKKNTVVTIHNLQKYEDQDYEEDQDYHDKLSIGEELSEHEAQDYYDDHDNLSVSEELCEHEDNDIAVYDFIKYAESWYNKLLELPDDYKYEN